MAKLPPPPSPDKLTPIKMLGEIENLLIGTQLWRVHFKGGPYPTEWYEFRHFGPKANARFDHHLLDLSGNPCVQHRGILYAGEHGPTCLVEVFQDTRVIDRRWREPWLAAFSLVQPLRLLDLRGGWPTRAGASQAISTGSRKRARLWSRAIYDALHDAYPDIHGLIYTSSMHGQHKFCVALYERAKAAMPTAPDFHHRLDDPDLDDTVRNTANDFGYGLV